jgi:hypothetical protein
MRWTLAVALVAGISGCSGPPPAPTPTVTVTPTPGLSVSGGCAESPLWTSGLPDWTASAAAPSGIPYVIAHEGNLVGVLFGHPLRAGVNVSNPSDKVLWIAREPRQGADLNLTLTRVDGTGEPVHLSFPANSSPGEIYPSGVEVPTPGCWRVAAEWAGNHATLELSYQ